MPALEAVPCSDEVAELGEGARWDGRTGRLAWVDIPAGVVRLAAPGPDGRLRTEHVLPVGRPVGAVAPAAGGGWVAAAGRGFVHLSVDGVVTELAEAVPDRTDVRMNDGACDRYGRFWAGTMAYDEAPGAGALFRLELDGTVTTVLDGLTISNGLGWRADGRELYLNDSGPGTVEAFALDVPAGPASHARELGERRLVARFEGAEGVPDGLAVDDTGLLWVACYGGGAVRGLTPAGERRAEVRVPAANTTSCAFGGPDGGTLYVTTATQGLDAPALAAQPDAGRVFRVAGTGARAAPALPYRGPVPGPGGGDPGPGGGGDGARGGGRGWGRVSG